MGALRKAGVWLGLVEDDDDRSYDDRSYRGYGDDFADDDDVDEAPVIAPRARVAPRVRVEAVVLAIVSPCVCRHELQRRDATGPETARQVAFA